MEFENIRVAIVLHLKCQDSESIPFFRFLYSV